MARVAVAIAAAAWVGACEPPDRPPQLPDALPRAALEHLAPDTVRSVRVADGVWYRYVWSPGGPWAIHLLEADLARCELGLQVVRADGGGEGGGHARVTDMVAEAELRGGVAAVNGDFFTPEGTPLGPELTTRGLRTLRSRPVVAWRPGWTPWIGLAVADGERLGFGEPGRSTPGEAAPGPLGEPSSGAAADPPTVVVAGYPELLDGGARMGDLLVSDNPAFAASRHPRTAVGVDPERNTLWFVVVDGRQGDYSLGMTLPELAELFEALGVPEAINLDGGGSSVMVVRGRAVSQPSDEGGERAVVNALVLRSDPGFCAVVRR